MEQGEGHLDYTIFCAHKNEYLFTFAPTTKFASLAQLVEQLIRN